MFAGLCCDDFFIILNKESVLGGGVGKKNKKERILWQWTELE